MITLVTFRFMPDLAREIGADSFVPMPMENVPRERCQVTVVGHVRTEPNVPLEQCKRFEVSGYVRSVTYTVTDMGHIPDGPGRVRRDMDERVTIWLGRYGRLAGG